MRVNNDRCIILLDISHLHQNIDLYSCRKFNGNNKWTQLSNNINQCQSFLHFQALNTCDLKRERVRWISELINEWIFTLISGWQVRIQHDIHYFRHISRLWGTSTSINSILINHVMRSVTCLSWWWKWVGNWIGLGEYVGMYLKYIEHSSHVTYTQFHQRFSSWISEGDSFSYCYKI